jgi:hypothetical protein
VNMVSSPRSSACRGRRWMFGGGGRAGAALDSSQQGQLEHAIQTASRQ